MFNNSNTYGLAFTGVIGIDSDKDVSLSQVAEEIEDNPSILSTESDHITRALIKGLEAANEGLDVAGDAEGCIENIEDAIKVFDLLSTMGEDFPLEASGDDSFGLRNKPTFNRMLYLAQKFLDSDASDILLRHTQRMIEYRDCVSLKELAEDEVYGTLLEIQEIYNKYAY